MAMLTVDELSLEIAYRSVGDEWVHYNIWVRWRGEHVINDAILKRWGNYWGKRSVGAILACEHSECGILPLLRRVLDTHEPDYWQPTDPDIVLALYPDGGFPFLPSKMQLLWESPERKAEREAREKEREISGPLPDDLVELVLFVDVYNFEGASAYCADGICFRLTPTRAALERFYNDLRNEYETLRARRSLDTSVARDEGLEQNQA